MREHDISYGAESIRFQPKIFVRSADATLFTPEVASHIASALHFPHVETVEGKKDRMHAIKSKNGRVGLYLLTPLPSFESSRPERVILGFEANHHKGGVLLFEPTAVITDLVEGMVTIKKEIEGYESMFMFDQYGHFDQSTGAKTQVLI